MRTAPHAPSLVERVYARFPQRQPSRSMAPMRRKDLDTPFSQVRVARLEEQFYQYDWRCLLVVESGGTQYLYVPHPPSAAMSHRSSISTLPLVQIGQSEPWLDEVRARFCYVSGNMYTPTLGDDPAMCPAPAGSVVPGELDGGHFLRDDLRRLTVGRSSSGEAPLGAILATLDLFACFRGYPRDNSALPRALLGRDAVALLRARGVAALTEPVLAGLEAGGLVCAAAGVHQFIGVIDRREVPEGQSRGYDAELAIVALRVSVDSGAWTYERRVVWSESQEGSPWS